MNEKHGYSFIEDYLYILATCFILWEINRQVTIYTRKKYASYKDSRKRIFMTAAGVVLVTILLMTGISAFYDITDWWGYEYKPENYLYNNFAALTYCIIITVFTKAFITFVNGGI